MANCKVGFDVELKDKRGVSLTAYLPPIESSLLRFLSDKLKTGDFVNSIQIANYLWREKYPDYLLLVSNEGQINNYKIQNADKDVRKVFSSIKNKFEAEIIKNNFMDIYEPYPFFVAKEIASSSLFITLSSSINEVIFRSPK